MPRIVTLKTPLEKSISFVWNYWELTIGIYFPIWLPKPRLQVNLGNIDKAVNHLLVNLPMPRFVFNLI